MSAGSPFFQSSARKVNDMIRLERDLIHAESCEVFEDLNKTAKFAEIWLKHTGSVIKTFVSNL